MPLLIWETVWYLQGAKRTKEIKMREALCLSGRVLLLFYGLSLGMKRRWTGKDPPDGTYDGRKEGA